MVCWACLALREVSLNQMSYSTVVFTMCVYESAVLRSYLQKTNQVVVTDFLVSIGHVDLEGRET